MDKQDKQQILQKYAPIFADNLATIRTTKGLSQTELAELFETKAPGISRLESGKHVPTSTADLLRYAEILDCSVGDFFRPVIDDKEVEEVKEITIRIISTLMRSRLSQESLRHLLRFIGNIPHPSTVITEEQAVILDEHRDKQRPLDAFSRAVIEADRDQRNDNDLLDADSLY